MAPASARSGRRQRPRPNTASLRDAGTSRDLAQLGADVLLQLGWPPPQDAILRTLAHTRWLIVAAPSFWARHGVPRHPSELARLPCALFRTPYGEVMRRWIVDRGDERVEVDGWRVGDHRDALDAPVFAGQLVARLSDLTTRQGLRDGTLQPVLLGSVGQSSPPLNLLLRRSLARQPRGRAFVDFMVEQAEAPTHHLRQNWRVNSTMNDSSSTRPTSIASVSTPFW